MTAKFRRAVAPGLGVKGNLRHRAPRERRHGVQGSPRSAQFFHAIDWGYVGFLLAVAATVFVAVTFALGRAS